MAEQILDIGTALRAKKKRLGEEGVVGVVAVVTRWTVLAST